MCQYVIYKGSEFDTVSELRAISPILVMDKSYKRMEDDQCLCCVDIKATAEKNGYSVQNGIDSFEWIFEDKK